MIVWISRGEGFGLVVYYKAHIMHVAADKRVEEVEDNHFPNNFRGAQKVRIMMQNQFHHCWLIIDSTIRNYKNTVQDFLYHTERYDWGQVLKSYLYKIDVGIPLPYHLKYHHYQFKSITNNEFFIVDYSKVDWCVFT